MPIDDKYKEGGRVFFGALLGDVSDAARCTQPEQAKLVVILPLVLYNHKLLYIHR